MTCCGPGNLGDKIIPDRWINLDLRAACRAHDISYDNPGAASRRECDRFFLTAMLALAADRPTVLRRFFARWIVRFYYLAVRIGGGRAWRRARNRAATVRERVEDHP